jgi:hypothetical protein
MSPDEQDEADESADAERNQDSESDTKSHPTLKSERWITIGGDKDPDGDGGGTHVKIDDDGKIVAGPEGLADKGIQKLSDFGKNESGESKPEEKPKPIPHGEVSFRASAPGHMGGKQHIAEITGADGQFGMDRDFVDKKTGKKRDESEHTTNRQGLFEESDITSAGKKVRHFVTLHHPETGVLTKHPVDKETAQAIANHIGGDNIENVVHLRDGKIHMTDAPSRDY